MIMSVVNRCGFGEKKYEFLGTGNDNLIPVEEILSVAYNNRRIIPVIFAADDIVAVLVLLRSGKGYEVLYCVTGLMLPFLGFVVVDVYLGYGVMILIPADKEAVENAVVVADKRVVV